MFDIHKINNTVVKVGGSLKNRFVPNINASKWNDECFLNVNFSDIVKDEKECRIGDKSIVTLGNNTHRFYKKSKFDFEHEIIFEKRPSSDEVITRLAFPVGLTFHFQPALTQDEIERGCIRPPNVVGSYAVYWNKSWNEYQTGKFCHIYRPELIDATGRKEWCNLLITPETRHMIIYMPKAWLDSAIYPVLLDPTFGYTTAGGTSTTQFGSARIIAPASGAPTSNGTVSKLTCYLNTLGANVDFKVGLYTDSSGPASKVGTEQETTGINISDGSQDWTDFSYSTSVTNGTTYWCSISGSGSSKLYYDSGGNRYYDDVAAYSDAWPATYDINSSNTFTYSIYATYAASTANPDSWHPNIEQPQRPRIEVVSY